MIEIEDYKKKLLQSIIDANRGLANSLMNDFAMQTNYRSALSLLFEPVLDQIGEMWFAEKLSLAQGYFAGKIAEDVFNEASKSEEFILTQGKSKGNVVIGNIEDDFHSLGRKLIGTFLHTSGWKVVDLGNDILAKDFVDKALETESSIIGVSAMMYTTAINISSLRDEIDKRNLTNSIKLAVGGAVFKLRPELVAEVGGDATADNALKVPDLFDNLLKEFSDD